MHCLYSLWSSEQYVEQFQLANTLWIFIGYTLCGDACQKVLMRLGGDTKLATAMAWLSVTIQFRHDDRWFCTLSTRAGCSEHELLSWACHVGSCASPWSTSCDTISQLCTSLNIWWMFVMSCLQACPGSSGWVCELQSNSYAHRKWTGCTQSEPYRLIIRGMAASHPNLLKNYIQGSCLYIVMNHIHVW